MSGTNERQPLEDPKQTEGSSSGRGKGITPEDVTAFAAGILDDGEAERIAAGIRENPELLQFLDVGLAIRLALEENSRSEPPRRLVERTIQLGYMAHAAERCRWSFASLIRYPVSPTVMRVIDVAVAALILLVLATLLFPALAHMRELQRTVACRDNLRQIGLAQLAYADQYGGRLPQTGWSFGSGAPAAIQPVILMEHGYLNDASCLRCCPDHEVTVTTVAALQRELITSPQRVAEALRGASGSYAFFNGWFLDRCYEAPRLPSAQRGLMANFVLAADRPARDQTGGVLLDVNSANHSGRGQNVLCGDMRVVFAVNPRLGPAGDKIYANRAERVGASLGWSDISLSPGDALPDGPYSIYYSADRPSVRTCF